MTERWMFLGVAVQILTEPCAPVAVAEGVLPQGASPPLHVHANLDDSFYLLDGQMVVRCGHEVTVATAGSWVQFPSGVPHTFRVMDRPARVLMVHGDDSFIQAIKTIGRSASDNDVPTTTGGPTIGELDQALAAHHITNVGPRCGRCRRRRRPDGTRRSRTLAASPRVSLLIQPRRKPERSSRVGRDPRHTF